MKLGIFEAYRAAANAGDADGQQCLAWCYEQGVGVPKDFDLMMQWLGIAAVNGSRVAQLELARRYAAGDGVARDELRALEYQNMTGSM